MLHKHFKQCTSPKNVQLLIGSEAKTSVAFPCWLINKEVEDELVLCNFHNKNVNLRGFINFCTNDKTPDQVQQCSFYQNNQELIELVSTVKKIMKMSI